MAADGTTNATELNAEFLKLVQDQGMVNIATDVGIVTSGGDLSTNIPSAQTTILTDTTTATKGKGKKRAKTTTLKQPSAKKAKKRIQRVDGQTGRGGKASKGLRHFSAKVCEKVKQKGTTTYNQVADELVREFAARVLNNAVDQTYDEKNIRRRVYDALNVLMAMDIIAKDKKQISWHGLPANVDHDLGTLRKDEEDLKKTIQQKKDHLSRMLQNQIMYKKLVMRNGTEEHKKKLEDSEATPIRIPFIILSTDKETIVEAEMNEERSDIFFNFTQEFKIHDDEEVCRQLQLHKVSREELPTMINQEFIQFLPQDYFPGEPLELEGGSTSSSSSSSSSSS